MSKQRANRTVKRINDLEMGGSPPVFVELVYEHVSDTVAVNLDSERTYTFDRAIFAAIMDLAREIKERG